MKPTPIVALAALGILSACGGSPVQPAPGTGAPAPRIELTTRTFTIAHAAAGAAAVSAIAEIAERHVVRIAELLGVEPPERVRVTYYDTYTQLAEAVRPIVGAIPSWATGLVTASDRIHLLYPATATPAQIEDAATVLVHEFAHCLTLRLNASSANNPRWLWETIALYAARQFREPSGVGALRGGRTPSIEELNSFDTAAIYDVGFVLGEFIVDRGGSASLRQLALTRGDTAAVLGIAAGSFLGEWRAWVAARYGA